MKKIKLPKKSLELINRYENLYIQNFHIQCPYYQNILHKKNKTVFVGKALPDEIEREANNLLANKSLDKDNIKLYMIMADLGIDCSGFVTRVIESIANSYSMNKINKIIQPKRNNILSLIKHNLRIYTNLSADLLTSEINTIKIDNINSTIPGDLIRIGSHHVAIITEVWKNKKNDTMKIIYYHSTSDYLDQHGVRRGEITITNPNKNLDNQEWNEIYQKTNWTKKDYDNIESSNKGIRRLKGFMKVLENQYSSLKPQLVL